MKILSCALQGWVSLDFNLPVRKVLGTYLFVHELQGQCGFPHASASDHDALKLHIVHALLTTISYLVHLTSARPRTAVGGGLLLRRGCHRVAANYRDGMKV